MNQVIEMLFGTFTNVTITLLRNKYYKMDLVILVIQCHTIVHKFNTLNYKNYRAGNLKRSLKFHTQNLYHVNELNSKQLCNLNKYKIHKRKYN
jgi:hypothetical protein